MRRDIPVFFLVFCVAASGAAAPGSSAALSPAPATAPAAPGAAAAGLQTTPGGLDPAVNAGRSLVGVERVTLDDALSRAMRRNPTAQSAALELDRADALVRQARAASLPTLNGNVTFTRLDHERALGTRVVAAENQLNANVVLSVPLIAPAKWAQWSHAKDDAQVVRLSSDEIRRQLAISVARTFLSVVSQHRVVAANELALEASKAHERYAAERLSGGVGKRIDAVRASQQVSSILTTVHNSRVALARSMAALGVLLGEDHAVDVAVDPELGAAPDDATALAGIQGRVDFTVARARQQAATKRFNDSWIDFMPQLSGQLQPFYQTPATLSTPTTGWQAMLILTVPFYDGGVRYGARQERRVLAEQAELALANLQRQAKSEVRIAFEAARGAEAALVAAKEAADLAHDAEKMALLAYQAGAVTNLEVIDAERQARDADTAVAVSEDTLRQARLDLLIASGRFPTKQ